MFKLKLRERCYNFLGSCYHKCFYDIFTCHHNKSTGVTNYSRTWYCACWLTWNRTLILIINCTILPLNQNVSCEKGLYGKVKIFFLVVLVVELNKIL